MSTILIEDDRNPFECPVCDVLYSSSMTSDDSPTYLDACDHTMCVKCVKTYRSLDETDNTDTPYYTTCTICDEVSWDGEEPKREIVLIDVIRELEVMAKPSFFGAERIKPEHMESLKCPCCKKAYSKTRATIARALSCGHVLCFTCVEEKKQRRSGEEKELNQDHHTYKIDCPKCDVRTIFTNNSFVAKSIGDAIRWLKKKRETVVPSEATGNFDCSACGLKTPCERGILCTDCASSDGELELFALCAFCVYDAHQGHVTEKFLPHRLRLVESNAMSEIHSKVVKCNKDVNGIVDEYKALMGKVEESFSAVIGTIPLASNYGDSMQIGIDLKEKREEYEDIMEKMVPLAKKQNKLLEDLLNKLKERFPVLLVPDGESEETEDAHNETEDGETEDAHNETEDGEIEEDEETADGERQRKRRRVEDRETRA